MAPRVRAALAAGLLAAALEATAHGGAHPPALAGATAAWQAGHAERALAIIARGLACDEPHALALAARIGEARGTAPQPVFGRAQRAWATPPRTRCSRSKARARTPGRATSRATPTSSCASGSKGVDEDLERAMRGLAKRMDEAQRSQALERARTMLRAIAQALADDPCAGGPGWV